MSFFVSVTAFKWSWGEVWQYERLFNSLVTSAILIIELVLNSLR